MKKQSFWENWGSFLLAVLAILGVRWALFEPYVIPSGSMIPTLLVHDHILVNKAAYGVRFPFSSQWLLKAEGPKRGDIVVFRSVEDSGFFMIKRVIGLPGDQIEVSEQGDLKINGEMVEQTLMSDPKIAENQKPFYAVTEFDIQGPYDYFDFKLEKLGDVHHRILQYRDAFHKGGSFKVPDDQYFCMGDNRDNSKDSRSWGSLPRENLLGRAMFIWLSCEETLTFLPFLCNPLTIRVGRIGHGIY